MGWNVEYADQFGTWWDSLTHDEQARVSAIVDELEERGPHLPFPMSSGIKGSRHNHMRELRIQVGGHPFRVLYAFDPERTALLLIGGDKTGDARWYEVNILLADDLYDQHLIELKKRQKNSP